MDEETLLEAFQESKDKAEIVQVLKELFDLQKIKSITDLKEDEIALESRILQISTMKNIPQYKECISIFNELRLSHDRKSRTEIIDAVKGWAQQFMRRGLGGLLAPPRTLQP